MWDTDLDYTIADSIKGTPYLQDSTEPLFDTTLQGLGPGSNTENTKKPVEPITIPGIATVQIDNDDLKQAIIHESPTVASSGPAVKAILCDTQASYRAFEQMAHLVWDIPEEELIPFSGDAEELFCVAMHGLLSISSMRPCLEVQFPYVSWPEIEQIPTTALALVHLTRWRGNQTHLLTTFASRLFTLLYRQHYLLRWVAHNIWTEDEINTRVPALPVQL